jgi:hypothetical protein
MSSRPLTGCEPPLRLWLWGFWSSPRRSRKR